MFLTSPFIDQALALTILVNECNRDLVTISGSPGARPGCRSRRKDSICLRNRSVIAERRCRHPNLDGDQQARE